MDQSAEVLAQLRDIHLPGLSEANILADWAAGSALGLLAAILVILLARAVVRRPASRRAAALAGLAASRQLQPAERLQTQARILQSLATPADLGPKAGTVGDPWPVRLGRRLGADFFVTGPGAGLSEALYRPGTDIDPDLVDRELARLLKRVKG